MQLLIVCSVNVSFVVTAFSELAQFFSYFLHTIVVDGGGGGGGVCVYVEGCARKVSAHHKAVLDL